MNLLRLLLFFLLPCLAFAIPPEEAAKHMGEDVTVTGVVIQVSTSAKGTVFLNFGGRYPRAVFSAVVFATDAVKFGDLAKIEGEEASVSGRVESYRGKSEIVLKSVRQLKSEP